MDTLHSYFSLFHFFYVHKISHVLVRFADAVGFFLDCFLPVFFLVARGDEPLAFSCIY